jgi:hypothetical protein
MDHFQPTLRNDHYTAIRAPNYVSGDRILVEARFSAPAQTGLGLTQPPIQWVPGTVPGDKAAGTWHLPSAPSSAEVKESVQLYIYFPSGPPWPILG